MKGLRKFRALLAAGYAEMVEYRAEIYLWVLSGIMPFVLMGLWMEASLTGDTGRDPVEFARYFYSVFVVRQVTLVWVIYEFESLVVRGTLSPYLLQPINPVWRFVASHLGERIARFPFLIALTAIFFALYPQAFWVPSLANFTQACLCLFLAFCLRFIMQYAFAMIAFWSERANAIEDLWFFLYLFLSGFIAPLDLFPSGVRKLAELTPFPYLIYMPAQLMIGNPVNLTKGLSVMALWGGFFFLLYQILWRCGLRRYSAMGA